MRSTPGLLQGGPALLVDPGSGAFHSELDLIAPMMGGMTVEWLLLGG